jgi:hypothetical protein
LLLQKDSDIDDAGAHIKKLGMGVSAYSLCNDFVKSDSAERDVQVEYVKKGIDIANTLNSSYLRAFSGEEKEYHLILQAGGLWSALLHALNMLKRRK